MYDVFYNFLQPSLKYLQRHYMDTDGFVLSLTEGNVDNEPKDLSDLDLPIKTNNKVPDKFKHELGSRIIEGVIALSPKTYSFKDNPNNTKEKTIKIFNNAKHEEYYKAIINNVQYTKSCR